MARAVIPDRIFSYKVGDVLKLVDPGGDGLWENYPFVAVQDLCLDDRRFDYAVRHLDDVKMELETDGAPAYVDGSFGWIRVQDIAHYVCSFSRDDDDRVFDRISLFEGRLERDAIIAREQRLAMEMSQGMTLAMRVLFMRVRGTMTRSNARLNRVFGHRHRVTTVMSLRLADQLAGWGWRLRRWHGGRKEGALRVCRPTTRQLVRYHPHTVLKKLRGVNTYLRATDFWIEWCPRTKTLKVSYVISVVVRTTKAALERALRRDGLRRNDIERIMAQRTRVIGRV
jgi:hypothetical protein